MNIERLISPLVPTLTPSDSGNRALELMEENNLTQLPLVEDDYYLALVQESEIMDWDNQATKLSDSGRLSYKPAIPISAHPFDALRITNQMNLSVLPVVDFENKYLGAITRETLLKYITETSGLDNPGGIIVLEMLPRNYSLYQIARICENEDVSILFSQVYTTPDGMLEVTLKTNRTSLEAVASSFERHEYRVKEVYGDQKNIEDVMGKYNLLMNYLNM